MTEGIIISIITSLCTLAGVIVTVLWGNKQTDKKVTEKTDLTLYRIQQLEEKQDKHNSVIERMYKVEDRLNVHDVEIKVANKRIKKLEDKK